MNHIMNVNGLKCALHMPPASVPRFGKKTGNGLWVKEDGEEARGEEIVQELPMGNPRPVFAVDEYPGCPANWMHGSGKASSYWLPVRSGCGMWLDFNHNDSHSHHVAVVLSIQGVNPITGQQTKTLRLEQYREKCPVHDKEFGQDRYCEECGYKWDGQNYICSNATPEGLFWIDGFRGGDGVVRQYVFTEDTIKGVATNIIGEERVFAIGVAFYLSKEPKKIKKRDMAAYSCGDVKVINSLDYSLCKKKSIALPDGNVEYDLCESTPSELNRDLQRFSPEEIEREMKLLEVTSGAKIRQKIYQDPEDLSFWQEEPAGFVYINYVDLDTAEKIVATGKKEMANSFIDKILT